MSQSNLEPKSRLLINKAEEERVKDRRKKFDVLKFKAKQPQQNKLDTCYTMCVYRHSS